MVIVLVLEQLSHRQRADRCKATHLQKKVVLESGKSVLGIRVSQGYWAGAGGGNWDKHIPRIIY